jgi:hypothetical protein
MKVCPCCEQEADVSLDASYDHSLIVSIICNKYLVQSYLVKFAIYRKQESRD